MGNCNTASACGSSEEKDTYNQAFGESSGISKKCRDDVYSIMKNKHGLSKFSIDYHDAGKNFSESAWELLGRYIANNNQLKEIRMYSNAKLLTDSNMPSLFKELTSSSSIEMLFFGGNEFGSVGIQSMAPFLKNSNNLYGMNLCNNNFQGEVFETLIHALNGVPIEVLYCALCKIDDASVLGNCILPNLRDLELGYNNIQKMGSLERYTNLIEIELTSYHDKSHGTIGIDGCKSIASLLANKRSNLEKLNLWDNKIHDEEAEILAESLKHNTKLKCLFLENLDCNYNTGNGMTERGFRAFSKLLADTTSIDSTYNSNHTLTRLKLPDYHHYFNDRQTGWHGTPKMLELWNNIEAMMKINNTKLSSGKCFRSEASRRQHIGRRKVIDTQLNSKSRTEICNLQEVSSKFSSLFVDIDSFLLPYVISLIGKNSSQNDVYQVLLAMAPQLSSHRYVGKTDVSNTGKTRKRSLF